MYDETLGLLAFSKLISQTYALTEWFIQCFKILHLQYLPYSLWNNKTIKVFGVYKIISLWVSR